MTTTPLKRGLAPMHPGALLREDVLPALDRPVSDVAKLLKVSRQTLHAILREEAPVTPAMALRLGKLCGNGPDLWVNLQARYDLARLAAELEDELATIPTLNAA
ncbi:HigA family addiction module antitoxin [Azospirillum brasilense]|uniref:HigA family addiction module antitoxin n=1 Tax=Azospirillum brasilense TaxID=192 RepID=UPI001EDAAD4A|nr:HigA family addiction module antitoxin [Azospirillum brasilense]UKJ76532.1 HigA family addiction module antidote protein [Azospirillum brasilense]